MKKLTNITLLGLVIFLTACSPATAARAQSIKSVSLESDSAAATLPPKPTTAPVVVGGLTTDYENSVSIEMQLALGAFELEDTANEITTAQAAALIPLWTNFKTLSQTLMPQGGGQGQQDRQPAQSGTPVAAPTIDSSVQDQISDTIEGIAAIMTDEQIKAIAGMKISRETAMTIMEEQGITMTGPGGKTDGSGQPSSGGKMPQGTPPAGGPGGGQGGEAGAPPSGTPAANGQQPAGGPAGRMGGGFISTELLEALIDLLEAK